jgi:hypothetical protein
MTMGMIYSCGHWQLIARNSLLSVMVKYTLVQALRLRTGRTAHRESRGIALPFLDHSTGRGEGSASRPGCSLPPGETRYPLYRRLGGPQGRSGQMRKISPPPGFDPRTVQPVALPTTLPGPLVTNKWYQTYFAKGCLPFVCRIFVILKTAFACLHTCHSDE